MQAFFYITIITAFSGYIIHKAHLFPLILDRFTVDEYDETDAESEPEPQEQEETQPQQLTPVPIECRREPKPQQATAAALFNYDERRKLEGIAANILTASGARFDVWGAVRGLPTSELITLINNGM